MKDLRIPSRLCLVCLILAVLLVEQSSCFFLYSSPSTSRTTTTTRWQQQQRRRRRRRRGRHDKKKQNSFALSSIIGPADSSSLLSATIDLDSAKEMLVYSYSGDLDVTKAVPIAAGLVFLVAAAAAKPPARLVSPTALQSIVEGTFLGRGGSNVDLQCVYKASRDGWSATDFHEKCDNAGSGVVIGRTLTGKVFGAYNPVGWRSTDDYSSSSAAFLFSLSGNKVMKFPVRPGGDGAIYDYATSGPCFGASDLLIGPPRAAVMGLFTGPDMEDVSANAGNLRRGKSFVGGTYEVPDNQRWPVAGNFQLSELEIYCNVKI